MADQNDKGPYVDPKKAEAMQRSFGYDKQLSLDTPEAKFLHFFGMRAAGDPKPAPSPIATALAQQPASQQTQSGPGLWQSLLGLFSSPEGRGAPSQAATQTPEQPASGKTQSR